MRNKKRKFLTVLISLLVSAVLLFLGYINYSNTVNIGLKKELKAVKNNNRLSDIFRLQKQELININSDETLETREKSNLVIEKKISKLLTKVHFRGKRKSKRFEQINSKIAFLRHQLKNSQNLLIQNRINLIQLNLLQKKILRVFNSIIKSELLIQNYRISFSYLMFIVLSIAIAIFNFVLALTLSGKIPAFLKRIVKTADRNTDLYKSDFSIQY